MGLVYAEITLINGEDISLAKRHIIGQDEIKQLKNRATTCRAMVLSGDSEPFLGAIPLEDMDVLIHTQRHELIVNPEHPYNAQMKLN